MARLLDAALVALGAAAGGLTRWGVSLWLTPLILVPGMPLGTWVVNAAGGFLIGLALVVLGHWPYEAWRLLLVTGFLGGLTTFSAFSVELLLMLQQGFWRSALIHITLHVAGSLAAATAGLWLGQQIFAEHRA